ncbi:DENN domain-containing protein 3-like isoform X2 [Gouania willdenowi]|uniref:DENN domain-containing protein 3-like n=1 Tax=Gouania willdenowi TaxID=441366 RepID=A0A8C5ES15_GOUWI|nr:DENN domain-containing protein 3-like isoform X2 [Gouania willdenowi]
MADYLPPSLLEACVVVGAPKEKLQEVYQAFKSTGTQEHLLLEPEVLHVLEPPFVSKPQSEWDQLRSHGKKARSIRRRRRQRLPAATTSSQGEDEAEGTESENISVPKDIDLMALPQLCFPGGLLVTTERKEEQFHFLVFTDVFGNKSHGVVMQCYRPIWEWTSFYKKGAESSHLAKLFSAYSFCVISKYPYFNVLKDCLSCLLIQLRTCRHSDLEEKVKAFAAKLTLVPVPPPGQLHLMFNLHPLNITLPSREDKHSPAVDFDLHLPFLCFRPQQLLQVLSCLLQEQRVVFFSADWSTLTLVSESFLFFLQPLSWQQPYVPVLARGMLDFLMAPTAFIMGCHLSHYAEVAAETDDLIMVNIDNGTVSTSLSDTVDTPDIPPAAARCFIQRCQSLQLHFDVSQCHQASCTDINEQREQRRVWKLNLHHNIQIITLELIVNIFRDVSSHLNYEHRVFHSDEFLKSREPSDQLFYKKVLETHTFHSFLKDRLNQKMDAFARMELSTRSEIHTTRTMVEGARRPTMQEFQAREKSSIPENKLSKRLGMSLPNLGDAHAISARRCTMPTQHIPVPALIVPPKPVKVFKLPDFPAFHTFLSVQAYYFELIQQLGKAVFSAQNENSALLARFYYLRGLINTLCSRRLDALSDFQSLCKSDTTIFPTQLVSCLVDSLKNEERQQAQKRPELKRLLFSVKTDNEKPLVEQDNVVKKFKLPCKRLDKDEFVRCIQEWGIVKDVVTIHRLFDALSDDQPKRVSPDLFRDFYTYWKETESTAQDVYLPSEVIEHLDGSECVYKLSCCVKTSHGVGKLAMTQKRLFLLTEGRASFLEITKFRNIQEVRTASSPFLLVRIPSLRIQTSGPLELFEANLKAEAELWCLMVKEMWAGRRMADQHKDPQYMTQALTNALLMDAVVGCVHTQKSISAASKLAYFDEFQHEMLMIVPNTLKHRINPSQELPEPETVHALLYTPGQLSNNDSKGDTNPKLWVALGRGRVVVYDAASWSMLQHRIQVGDAQVNCMMGLIQKQVWIGSQDSIIYIIDTNSMFCNKQLTDHRHEVTGLVVDTDDQHSSQQVFSCSYDGTILQWDSSSLTVKRQFSLRCDSLLSLQIQNGFLWCHCGDSIVELKKNGTTQKRVEFPSGPQSTVSSFSSFVVIPERGQLWTGCADSSELCLWNTNDLKQPLSRVSLPISAGVTCMLRVKDQIWLGCCGRSVVGSQRSQVVVVDPESLMVSKVMQAHSDKIQSLCSAEDRYVLSGSACREGKIAIWKVE